MLILLWPVGALATVMGNTDTNMDAEVFLPWLHALTVRWTKTDRKISRRSGNSRRRPNSKWRVIAVDDNGSGCWEGGQRGLNELGMVAVILRVWGRLP